MSSGNTIATPARIITRYWFNGEVVKTNAGSNLFEAGPNVQRNLQINKYGATFAEVLDADTEQLYYSQSRSISGTISKPHYEWNPEDTARKYSAGLLLLGDKKGRK
jgi:hypothetical protein